MFNEKSVPSLVRIHLKLKSPCGNQSASSLPLSPIAALLTVRNKWAALIFEAQQSRMHMGWEEMFTALVDEHYQTLYRFALSLTRSESDASDLTQQTFLIWANKGHQLREAAKAKFWLFRTLHRSFL